MRPIEEEEVAVDNGQGPEQSLGVTHVVVEGVKL
jgi:hypothetical protein